MNTSKFMKVLRVSHPGLDEVMEVGPERLATVFIGGYAHQLPVRRVVTVRGEEGDWYVFCGRAEKRVSTKEREERV